MILDKMDDDSFKACFNAEKQTRYKKDNRDYGRVKIYSPFRLIVQKMPDQAIHVLDKHTELVQRGIKPCVQYETSFFENPVQINDPDNLKAEFKGDENEYHVLRYMHDSPKLMNDPFVIAYTGCNR